MEKDRNCERAVEREMGSRDFMTARVSRIAILSMRTRPITFSVLTTRARRHYRLAANVRLRVTSYDRRICTKPTPVYADDGDKYEPGRAWRYNSTGRSVKSAGTTITYGNDNDWVAVDPLRTNSGRNPLCARNDLTSA